MLAELFIIRGHVQGVGYRWWTERTARRLGLAGWVQNQRDGTVHILVMGDRAMRDALAIACERGPQEARVDAVERRPAEEEVADGFKFRPTA